MSGPGGRRYAEVQRLRSLQDRYEPLKERYWRQNDTKLFALPLRTDQSNATRVPIQRCHRIGTAPYYDFAPFSVRIYFAVAERARRGC